MLNYCFNLTLNCAKEYTSILDIYNLQSPLATIYQWLYKLKLKSITAGFFEYFRKAFSIEIEPIQY